MSSCGKPTWEQYGERVLLQDIPIFKHVSMVFHFKKEKSKKRDTLIFAKIDCIFTLNFQTGETMVILKYDTPLTA